MNRTIEDDAAKLCGTPPHNSPANICYGDGYFDADCRRMWGESAWSVACRKARDKLNPQPLPPLPHAPPPPPKRNAYTTTRNPWGMGVTHTCDACAQTFRGEHSAAWHECPGKAAGWPYSDAAAMPKPGAPAHPGSPWLTGPGGAYAAGSPEDPFFERGGTTTGRATDQRGSMYEVDRTPAPNCRCAAPKADLLALDFRHLEERVVASLGDFDEAAAFGLAQWVALGYSPYSSAMLCSATGLRCQTTGRCSEPAGCLRKRGERCPWDDFKPAREVV